MADRDIVAAERQIEEEEQREKEAYRKEQLREQRKREREEIRVNAMRMAVEKKLKGCADNALSKRKGKGKARDDGDDALAAIARRVVEYALVGFLNPDERVMLMCYRRSKRCPPNHRPRRWRDPKTRARRNIPEAMARKPRTCLFRRFRKHSVS
jgi:hypothetical protein